MIDRYSRLRMKGVWSTRRKLENWLRIEILVCEYLAGVGEIPKASLAVIRKKARVDPLRMEAIEKKVKHDVISFLTMISEKVGPDSRFIHFGLTSSDVLDTGLAVQLQNASVILLEDLKELKKILRKRAFEFKKTIMVGRSHGIHGEPITFGFKLAVWYSENERNIARLQAAKENVRFGKLSGAMGTFAHLSPEVEAYVCDKLGLIPAPVSNQVLQRDRHAQFMATLAIIAGSIDKIATEIRHLQRTEVFEVEEFFSVGQKGSSAMPHKRNPISSENLSGLARIIRSNSQAALDNIVLWHERDISHSSVERVILPDSTILLDFMLHRLSGMIDSLLVYPENMKENLDKTGGLIYSQRILLEMARHGAPREKAYAAVQQQAMKAFRGNGDFPKLIKSHRFIREYLKPSEIDNCFEPEYYIRHMDKIFKRVFE